jgi:hypothetical protein
MRKSDILVVVLGATTLICICGRAHSRISTRYSMGETSETDFSRRLLGGTLLRFESGLIVVKPTDPPVSLQPTALTTDAIINSSVKSKIADRSQLRTRSFEIQTDNGVVTIRAKEESLEDAAEVINLALSIPEVREIVYAMPSSVS